MVYSIQTRGRWGGLILRNACAIVLRLGRLCRSGRDTRMIDSHIGLYTILFYFKDFVHESIILLLPPPTCTARTIAILVHVYCAMYDAPPTPLWYAINPTILVMTISCKGQLPQ